MNSVTVVFIDGSNKDFAAAVLTLSDAQFWLEILDGQGNSVGLIPREQIRYVVTNFNTAP
ncbi:MAG TPA: hypothetical protein VGQ12_07765 [Candidatus Angelobacter sp.]|nr:hypothetical protein [Candidatus Angelobacter sp.]